MPTAHLTKGFIERIKPPMDCVQNLFWDSELKGFGLLVGKNTKTFVVQKSGGRRITIGRYGLITPYLARKKAIEKLSAICNGTINQAPSITLQEAHILHKESMVRKNCSPRSIEDGNYRLKKYLSDWLNRPLCKISRYEVRERHTKIGNNNGPYMANSVFRTFRAIYNTALKEEDLPTNPCIAIHWYKEFRRQEPIENLFLWHQEVKKIKNPVRFSYQLFLLFTGLRRRDGAAVRWDELNFNQAALFRPNPKGGSSRAFTLPISSFCFDLLIERQRENQILYPETPWVFPTRLRNGTIKPIQEPKEPRLNLPSPHRLRDTYHTACQEAGLSPYDIDVLTNHRPPSGSVSAGYIRQSFGHLSKCQEKVSQLLLDRIKENKTG